MKFTFFFVTLALVDAFAPPRPMSRPARSALQLEILGSEVSESVLAALGLAVIGGAAIASGKLGTKAAPGDETAVAPTPEPEPEPEAAAAPEEPSDDVSIPYDAAAKLAYEAAGSEGDYEEYKTKFEADAVAEVVAKKEARESA
jgi:hypothetical protein